jgi:hypothetical protein
MAGITSKSFDTPDETRTPVVKTDSCQVEHIGMAASGRLHVVHDDGTEVDVVPGAAYHVAPGHDAWVVGDEPFIGYEFESHAAETFARPTG